MKEIAFEWDENKNKSNITKHSVSFQEAITVFYDDYAILFDDPVHSKDEERFLILGQSSSKRKLIVSHCYRDRENKIRIISARRATKKESKYYLERLGITL